MEKQWTVQEVIDLQNQQKELNQRIAIHKERAAIKQKELLELLAKAGVSSIDELSNLCVKLNQEMQTYANEISDKIAKTREKCNELDAML